MATLREIRERIGGVKSIIKITSAMKLVAAAKMKRAQDAITAAKPYAAKVSDVLSFLASNAGEVVDPLLQERETIGSIGLIVISADRGLCGGFNANLMKKADKHIASLKDEYPSATISVIPVGQKACDHFEKSDIEIVEMFPGVFSKLDFGTAQDIARIAVDMFTAEDFDMVQIIVNEFVSVVKQVPTVEQFLPIVPSKDEENDSPYGMDFIVEPSLPDVLSSLLPKHLNLHVWRSMLDSNAAEQAARMFSMDNATRNAEDLLRDLELNYNKARQAAITTEILEVVGGAEALSK